MEGRPAFRKGICKKCGKYRQLPEDGLCTDCLKRTPVTPTGEIRKEGERAISRYREAYRYFRERGDDRCAKIALHMAFGVEKRLMRGLGA